MTRVPDNPTTSQMNNAVSLLQQAGQPRTAIVSPPPQTTQPAITPTQPSSSQPTTNVMTARKPPLDLSEPILDPETAVDLLFQDIGGVELADMMTYGTVSGVNQRFRVITNMNDWRQQYDPTALVSENKPGYGGAIQMPIRLSDKIPDGSFISIERYNPTDVVSDILLDLVVILQNMEPDEELEIEVVSDGRIYGIS